MRSFVALSVLFLVGLPPAVARAEPPVAPVMRADANGQPLYFAVEVRREGKVVGTPKLLGAEGKRLAVEKRRPGAESFDYRLVLFPNASAAGGDRYELALDVAVPGMSCHYDLELEHGKVRKLGEQHGKGLEVELTVLKVDSPEFRALMDLTAPQKAADRSSI